jgi:hypothetical protein
METGTAAGVDVSGVCSDGRDAVAGGRRHAHATGRPLLNRLKLLSIKQYND